MKILLIHVKDFRSLPEGETGANPFKTLPVIHGVNGFVHATSLTSESSLPVGNGVRMII